MSNDEHWFRDRLPLCQVHKCVTLLSDCPTDATRLSNFKSVISHSLHLQIEVGPGQQGERGGEGSNTLTTLDGINTIQMHAAAGLSSLPSLSSSPDMCSCRSQHICHMSFAAQPSTHAHCICMCRWLKFLRAENDIGPAFAVDYVSLAGIAGQVGCKE